MLMINCIISDQTFLNNTVQMLYLLVAKPLYKYSLRLKTEVRGNITEGGGRIASLLPIEIGKLKARQFSHFRCDTTTLVCRE